MRSIARRVSVAIVNTFAEEHPGCNYVRVDDELIPVREYWNEYDENAVLFLRRGGMSLGHISRHLAAVLSPLMKSGSISLKAKVREVTRNHGGNISVIIKLTVVEINLSNHNKVALLNSIDRLQEAGTI